MAGGYREVRYPKQERVRESVEGELTRQVKVAADAADDVPTGMGTATPA